MRKLTVKKDRLLERLKHNRETHVADFEIAWDAFQERAIENTTALLERLKRAGRGEPIQLWVGLDPPENHADDYDRAIEMVDWEVGDHLELTEQEFQNYVQNIWGWTQRVEASNVMYAGSTSPSTIRGGDGR